MVRTPLNCRLPVHGVATLRADAELRIAELRAVVDARAVRAALAACSLPSAGLGLGVDAAPPMALGG